ncbi:MAG: translation elongation factor-like protein [bacterium]
MKEKKIGEVTHFFDHISVGIVKASSPIKVGDKVHFKGHTTDFEQEITEMQFDHKSIDSAKKGQEFGLKVKEQVREGDDVLGVD